VFGLFDQTLLKIAIHIARKSRISKILTNFSLTLLSGDLGKGWRTMHVLVVQSDEALGRVWCNHLERQGATAVLATDEALAVDALRWQSFDVLVIDLMAQDCSVLSVADLATYRCPDIAIIVVTANSFFSDGSIFDVIPNARGFLNSSVPPEDLAAMVHHYGQSTRRHSGRASHAHEVRSS
jgi:DNA-binding NtrC family response regulator